MKTQVASGVRRFEETSLRNIGHHSQNESVTAHSSTAARTSNLAFYRTDWHSPLQQLNKINQQFSLFRRSFSRTSNCPVQISMSTQPMTICNSRFLLFTRFGISKHLAIYSRVGTLIVETIYLQLIQNRYMFRSFTVLQCSHQHCVQPVVSDVEVVGYL